MRSSFFYILFFINLCYILLAIYNLNRNIELSLEKNILKLEVDLLKATCYKCFYEEYLPKIIFVTPTSFRPEQKADLTRLGQTLSNICNLYWIIIEDNSSPSSFIDDLLNRLKIKGVHLLAQTPSNQKPKLSEPRWKYPRGVEQRNTALSWIRKNFNLLEKGIVYFGDDDNTYDWRLFDEMRKIKQKIGVWPVGIVGGMLVETPLLEKTLTNFTVNGFNSHWRPERPFPMDMAGFAINISLINEYSTSYFNSKSLRGFMESDFLQSLDIKKDDLEPLADQCTKVFVWHTRTERTQLTNIEFQKYLYAMNISSELSTVEEDAIF